MVIKQDISSSINFIIEIIHSRCISCPVTLLNTIVTNCKQTVHSQTSRAGKNNSEMIFQRTYNSLMYFFDHKEYDLDFKFLIAISIYQTL